ncbi:MAG: BlaI/MecI/CopY family transcriptional regulator [Bacteroidota bacterium]
MKELTKAEEQVMQHIWKLEKAFLKDIVAAFPDPKPAYTTISTVIRVLVKKGFLGFNTYSKVHEYYPLISRQDYFKKYFKRVIGSFFNGSLSGFASYLTDMEGVSVEELEEMNDLISQKIKKIRDDE